LAATMVVMMGITFNRDHIESLIAHHAGAPQAK